MQQTETYKLNLIETKDPFSPASLNENAEKLEAALSAAHAALDSRVTALEVHKIAVGMYSGNGHIREGSNDREIIPQTIQVGFDPMAVIVCQVNTRNLYITMNGYPFNYLGRYFPFEIIPGGFTVRDSYSSYTMNGPYDYWYLALA